MYACFTYLLATSGSWSLRATRPSACLRAVSWPPTAPSLSRASSTAPSAALSSRARACAVSCVQAQGCARSTGMAAWSNAPRGSARARLLRLFMQSTQSTLGGSGRRNTLYSHGDRPLHATARPATAWGARASCPQGRSSATFDPPPGMAGFTAASWRTVRSSPWTTAISWRGRQG